MSVLSDKNIFSGHYFLIYSFLWCISKKQIRSWDILFRINNFKKGEFQIIKCDIKLKILLVVCPIGQIYFLRYLFFRFTTFYDVFRKKTIRSRDIRNSNWQLEKVEFQIISYDIEVENSYFFCPIGHVCPIFHVPWWGVRGSLMENSTTEWMKGQWVLSKAHNPELS